MALGASFGLLVAFVGLKVAELSEVRKHHS
jgi:hypothetical protein